MNIHAFPSTGAYMAQQATPLCKAGMSMAKMGISSEHSMATKLGAT
jgi:alcohol dehydrogenase class IV